MNNVNVFRDVFFSGGHEPAAKPEKLTNPNGATSNGCGPWEIDLMPNFGKKKGVISGVKHRWASNFWGVWQPFNFRGGELTDDFLWVPATLAQMRINFYLIPINPTTSPCAVVLAIASLRVFGSKKLPTPCVGDGMGTGFPIQPKINKAPV